MTAISRRRALRLLTLAYSGLSLFLLFESYNEESLPLPAAEGGRPSLGVALFGSNDAALAGNYRDPEAERAASLARTGLIVAGLGYFLALGSLLGPWVLRVICGNLLVLVLLLLGIEGSTHLLGLHAPAIPRRSSMDRDLWVYDRGLGWFHAPNGKGELYHGGPDRGVVHINSLGLRGRDVSRAKLENAKRVLVFGDSFVFGLGVDEENLFTTHLERFLDRARGGRHEVVNFGVSGYSTDQELRLLQELGQKLFPDLVVLVMCDNDFQGNTEDFAYRRYYKPYFELERNGRLSLRNNPVPLLSRAQRVKLFLGQESNVWNFIRTRQASQPEVAKALSLFEVGVARPSEADPIELTFALVQAFAERVDAAGARLLVINTGHRGERMPLFHALRPKLQSAGIPILGLEGVLGAAREQAPEKLWDFPSDIHWNRDAHRLAAEVIAKHIVREKLL